MNFNIISKRIRAYSKNEWIAYRNERSTIPLDTILKSGFDVVECDCGKQGCLGWKLTRVPTKYQEKKPLPKAPTPSGKSAA